MWLDLQKTPLMAQELKSKFIADYKTYTLALPRNSKHICTYLAIDGQVCFYRRLIVDPIKSPRWITGSVGTVNGINRDVSGARLLSMTALTYPVDWVYFCHLLKTQHCCLCPNERYNPPLPPTFLLPIPLPIMSHQAKQHERLSIDRLYTASKVAYR